MSPNMTATRAKLRELLALQPTLLQGTVTAVDGAVCTVDTGDGEPWANVLLRPTDEDATLGVAIVPAQDSTVYFVPLDELTGTGLLVPGLCTEWASIEVRKKDGPEVRLNEDNSIEVVSPEALTATVGDAVLEMGSNGDTSITAKDATLEMTNDGSIALNGGSNGPLIVLDNLIQRLNTLEQLWADVITWLGTHTHTSAAPGVPTSPPVAPFTGTPPPPTTAPDLENPDVTH